MKNQDSCGPLFKRWVRFLKDKKIYGRYILYIQEANRKKDEVRQVQRYNTWGYWNYTFGDSPITCKPNKIYLSKNDYFKDRFEINSLKELRKHLFDVYVLYSYFESDFWFNTFEEFKKIEERKNPKLPIPRGFRPRHRKFKGKGLREENSPWYSNYYQDKKVLWRR